MVSTWQKNSGNGRKVYLPSSAENLPSVYHLKTILINYFKILEVRNLGGLGVALLRVSWGQIEAWASPALIWRLYFQGQVVGRIQFLAVLGLRFLFPCCQSTSCFRLPTFLLMWLPSIFKAGSQTSNLLDFAFLLLKGLCDYIRPI